MGYLHPNHDVGSFPALLNQNLSWWIRGMWCAFQMCTLCDSWYTKIWKPLTLTSQIKLTWFLHLKGIITATDITTTTSCILRNVELLSLARVWMEKWMSDEKMCMKCNRLNTFHLASNCFVLFFGWNSIWWVTSGYVVTALNLIPLQKEIKRN